MTLRSYLLAAYARLADGADRVKLDKWLDEPLARELTAEQRHRRDLARIADANRAAVAAIGRTAEMRRPG